MHILQTKTQREISKLPSRLEVLRELQKREALDKSLKEEWYRLETGNLGEQAVLNEIRAFGADHWKVLKNVWLEHYGVFESDLLLITSCGLHTFEVKNYNGDFDYNNNQCFLNGYKIGHNAISQAQKAATNLQQLFESAFCPVPVRGGLIFAGKHCDVNIQHSIDDLDILMFHQLRNHLEEIAKQDRGCSINEDQILQIIEEHETQNPFSPEPISDDIKWRVKKGVLCAHCGSFEVDTSKAIFTCKSCGMRESRENAIVRTICEYGVIHFDKDLVLSHLVDFFGGQIARTTLRKYLKNHFTEKGQYKSSKFDNEMLPFVKLLPVLGLECYVHIIV